MECFFVMRDGVKEREVDEEERHCSSQVYTYVGVVQKVMSRTRASIEKSTVQKILF